MANNQHSFAKRQREIEKKRKADEKRARKQNKASVTSDLEESPPPVQTDETDDSQGPAAD